MINSLFLGSLYVLIKVNHKFIMIRQSVRIKWYKIRIFLSLGDMHVLNEINHKFIMISQSVCINWSKPQIYYN